MRPFSSAVPAALVLGALCAAAPAYVGQWHSHSDLSHVTSLIEHNGFVYAGTTGGIRRVTPSAALSSIASSETDFDNLDGLLDVWIQSLVPGSDGTLWAVARDGYVYQLQGSRWETFGRSYAAQGWRMNARAALPVGSSFFLGSEKGLTLFDTRLKASRLNVTRFRSETEVSVLSLLQRADTLFVGTDHGIFKAGVYFADPLNPPSTSGYPNLADPGAWAKTLPDTAYSLVVSGGAVVAGPPGTRLETPFHVEAVTGSPLVIGTQTYPADWNHFNAAVAVSGRVFAAGDSGLFASMNPGGTGTDAALLRPLKEYPRDTIYEIGAYNDSVWGQTRSGVHHLSATGDFHAVPTGIINSVEVIYRSLRNVKVDTNGDLYVGVWGTGLNRYQNGVLRTWTHATDPCIFQSFPPSDPFTVAQALSRPQYGGVYFAVSRATTTGDHQLVYLNTRSGTITCPAAGEAVAGNDPHAVEAFSSSLLGVASERGLTLFGTVMGFDGPELTFKGLWTLPGAGTDALDLATGAGGRPWVLIGGSLASVDLDSLNLSTAYHLTGTSDFSGADCKSLEADAAGLLWVGCANGLYSAVSRPDGTLGAVRRYGPDDGLLGLSILDMAVDPVTGKVWVATDRGVSMLEGPGQPAIPDGSLATVIAYPNPFKAIHHALIFKNLPRNSTLRLYDAAGTVVRTFRPSDLTGNEAQWDGKNEDGKPVTAGVYLFSVVSGTAVQRGKVIVAR